MRQPHRDELLERHLRTYLGDVRPAALAELRACMQWTDVAAGEAVMRQGEVGDAMYLVLSGRLRAYVEGDGPPRAVREMGRGQIVGEMSVITGEPRLATVVAVRDSVLVRVAKDDVARLLATSPELSVLLTRQIIEHLQSREDLVSAARPVTIAVLPVSCGVDAAAFARRLAVDLARFGRVRVVDADAVGVDDDARLSIQLGDIEASHDFVLLAGEDAPTEWTRQCCRGADEILLVADAREPPALHAIESEYLMRRTGRAEASEVLVLLHEPQTRCPQATRAWLARRPVSHHVHVRPSLDRDMARLARIESHTAVGLVFAGGGARGLSHLGVYKALHERGIDVDYVGGTSIGAIMAALVASDAPLPDVTHVARKSFAINPTGDFNVLPLLSLIKGRRLRRVIDGALHELLGFDADVEDLWKNCYCVASNYSQASESLMRSGNLGKALRASIAIPGALPPVVNDGDLFCDGGTFNNFPVDVMKQMRGVGTVIGADLDNHKWRRFDTDEVPGTWALLRDRLRPRPKRRYRFPSLVAYLMNVQILYSMSRQSGKRKLTDVYFNPPLERVGMLQWERFDEIVEQGHAHAVSVLDRLESQQLEKLQSRARRTDAAAA